jgi:PAP2 superfamily protein
MSNAAPFFVLLAVTVIVLATVFIRGWRRHRRAPTAAHAQARSIWAKLGLRWSPPAYLTVHAIAGLVVCMLGLWAFTGLADWITDQAAITRFDVRFDEGLHSMATPLGVTVAKFFSFIGGPAAMAALMIGGAIYLLVRRERLVLYGWLIAFAGGGALDWSLKTIFHRDRPAFPNPFVHALGYSFPSGHSMGSLIGIGMLAYLLTKATTRSAIDRTVTIVAIVLIAAVGFSRLYLGAHYPSDVLGGFAAGIVWLTACISAIEASSPHVAPITS